MLTYLDGRCCENNKFLFALEMIGVAEINIVIDPSHRRLMVNNLTLELQRSLLNAFAMIENSEDYLRAYDLLKYAIWMMGKKYEQEYSAPCFDYEDQLPLKLAA